MKSLVAALTAALCMAMFVAAHAHGDDKAKRGGIMGRGDDSVSIELVIEKGVVALYVDEHASDVPIPSERMQGWLSLSVRGRPDQEVRLIPAGGNKLVAPGLAPIAGQRLRARIVLPNGDEVSSVFLFK